jgi:hypothetical protein
MSELTLDSLAPPVRAFFDSLPKGNGETVLTDGGREVFRIRPTATPEDPRVKEHLAYLKRMVDERVIEFRLGEVAGAVWNAVHAGTGGGLPVPAAAAFPGGPVEYHWEVGPHQLSVEIPADESCHWFYRNKVTGGTWGTEAPITDGIPPQFLAYLQHLLSSAG